jgi:hypothetical protein
VVQKLKKSKDAEIAGRPRFFSSFVQANIYQGLRWCALMDRYVAHCLAQCSRFSEQAIVANAGENGAEEFANRDAIFMVTLNGIQITMAAMRNTSWGDWGQYTHESYHLAVWTK